MFHNDEGSWKTFFTWYTTKEDGVRNVHVTALYFGYNFSICRAAKILKKFCVWSEMDDRVHHTSDENDQPS